MTPALIFAKIGRGAVACAILSAATAASAQIVIDFETSNPFSGGTLSTEQASEGTTSLFLGAGQSASFDIPDIFAGQNVTIKMDIFDMGKWIDPDVEGHPANQYGPRWGISTGDHGWENSLGAGILERTFSGGNGYASHSGYGLQVNNGRTESWFTHNHYSGSSRAQFAVPGTGGSNDGSGWVAGPGSGGEWTTWIFTVAADGSTTIQLDGLAPVTTGTSIKTFSGAPTQIWLYGGSGSNGGALAGVYVDNITVVPEPSTYALMFGAVALGAVVIRRRKAAKAA